MPEEKFHIRQLEDLDQVAETLLPLLQHTPVVAFFGEMGAGKTTLIQVVCRMLGVEREVTSPTFALVNEFLSASGDPIYHFDFYRLDDPMEAIEFGLEEYLASGYPCLMEWPEKIEPFLPSEMGIVRIQPNPDGSRDIEFEFPNTV